MSTLSVSYFVVCVAPQYNIIAAAYKYPQRMSIEQTQKNTKPRHNNTKRSKSRAFSGISIARGVSVESVGRYTDRQG